MMDVKLDQIEIERVLKDVLGRLLSTAQAAALLGKSERQALRILVKYRREGAAALVHGNRGRKPPHSVTEDTAARVVALARGKYAGLNHSHFTRLLAEREGIQLSHQTVNRLLNRFGLFSSRRHGTLGRRIRRGRMPREGMLLQIGRGRLSWLENRGPRCTLLLAVDDATDTVVNAVFRPEEDTLGYFLLLGGVIGGPGIPPFIYIDRHGGFEFNCPPAPGHRPNEFARAIKELNIQRVHNNDPPFEGRVERMVDQIKGGLVDELRRVRAGTIDHANNVLRDFLPSLNERCRVLAQQPQVAYRPLDSSICLKQILCLKHSGRVAVDNTVKYGGRILQLLPDQEWPSYAGVRVEVLELIDGGLMVQYDGEVIPHQEVHPSEGALAPTPELVPAVKVMGKFGFGRPKLQEPATLQVMTLRKELDIEVKDSGESTAPVYGAATPGQQASGTLYSMPTRTASPLEASPGNWGFLETL